MKERTFFHSFLIPSSSSSSRNNRTQSSSSSSPSLSSNQNRSSSLSSPLSSSLSSSTSFSSSYRNVSTQYEKNKKFSSQQQQQQHRRRRHHPYNNPIHIPFTDHSPPMESVSSGSNAEAAHNAYLKKKKRGNERYSCRWKQQFREYLPNFSGSLNPSTSPSSSSSRSIFSDSENAGTSSKTLIPSSDINVNQNRIPVDELIHRNNISPQFSFQLEEKQNEFPIYGSFTKNERKSTSHQSKVQPASTNFSVDRHNKKISHNMSLGDPFSTSSVSSVDSFGHLSIPKYILQNQEMKTPKKK